MTREQEAIERIAKAYRDEMGLLVASPADLLLAKALLDAMLASLPCLTCQGTGRAETASAPGFLDCSDCTDGTVPPLLRWNEDA